VPAIAEIARDAGFRSAIGAPVIVDGATWCTSDSTLRLAAATLLLRHVERLPKEVGVAASTGVAVAGPSARLERMVGAEMDGAPIDERGSAHGSM
jgi:hypothetical protein